jgi:hypothetical protein
MNEVACIWKEKKYAIEILDSREFDLYMMIY